MPERFLDELKVGFVSKLNFTLICHSPGICIILVHLLIKFKLHFLPESVAVVSLGEYSSLKGLLDACTCLFPCDC